MKPEYSIVIPEDLEPTIQNETLTVYRLLGRPECSEMSLALIILNGENSQTMNTTTDAMYMILSGVGYFTIWDGGPPRIEAVREGDVVSIPEGVMYKDVGADLVMISMNHPAFDPDRVRIIE